MLRRLTRLDNLLCDQLLGVPAEILSEENYGSYNCLPRLRAWLTDLEQGEANTHDLKLFFLGNGRVGKSELCGRLRGEKFHGQRESTHGIQLGRLELGKHSDNKPIYCNTWDFGGQDIYLGTHALFLKSRALFVLAWHPDMETDAPYTEAVSGLQMRHRPLRYWLDYIHALAGPEARVIVVQTQCATEHAKRAPDLGDTTRFAFIEAITSCAEQDDGVEMLQLVLKRAARHRLEQPAPPRMPASWLAVRDRLFVLREAEKTIDRARFDALCAETHQGASADALLHYLHQAGDVFHQANVFGGAIMLDQQWALDGIYTLFKRDGVLPHLRQNGGVFSPGLLSALAWSGRYSEREQNLLLSMMESCDLVFPLQEYGHSPQYVMADALPDAAESSARIDREWRNAAVTHEVVAEYAFLHDGILRSLLGRIGRLAGPHAVYWRYGLCVYDQRTRSTARINSAQHPDGTGEIRVRASGENGGELCGRLLKVLEAIQIGTPPRIHGKPEPHVHRTLPHENTESATETLKFASQPASTSGKPAVYFSYSHGGTERPDLMTAAEALESALAPEFDVIRDKNSLENGQSISDFMREIGRGTRVLVLLSDRYLRSAYCMQELLYLYRRHLAEPAELQKHVLPVIVDKGLRLDYSKRMDCVEHWQKELNNRRQSMNDKKPENCIGTLAECSEIEGFIGMIDLMLKFLDDILMPRGAAIASDDYTAIKTALRALSSRPSQPR
jgi:internalin A